MSLCSCFFQSFSLGYVTTAQLQNRKENTIQDTWQTKATLAKPGRRSLLVRVFVDI